MSEPIILDRATLYHDDCLSILKTLPENSVDSVICDPPSGIAFMSRHWDSDKGGRDQWIDWLATIFKEVYRVMKPGAHGLVWALPRVSYWTAMALDNAGFNLRDRINYVFDSSELAKAFFESLNDAQREVLERLIESQDISRVQHIFGSGFPKGLNISAKLDEIAGIERQTLGVVDQRSKFDGCNRSSQAINSNWRNAENRDDVCDLSKKKITVPCSELAKKWDGYGTNLKPAVEDYWLIRKPLDGSIVENVMKWECGGLNIDKCRVDASDNDSGKPKKWETPRGGIFSKSDELHGVIKSQVVGSRYPAHLILDGSESVCGRFPDSNGSGDHKPGVGQAHEGYCRPGRSMFTHNLGSVGYKDKGSASRFFKSCPIDPFIYHSKASTADRSEGCEELEARFAPTMNDGIGGKEHNPVSATPKRNSHPTVKSTALFSYFATLLTKPGGLILDPFMGSGTTGVAAVKLGYRFIGCELESEYFAIAQSRIKAAQKQQSLFNEAESFFPSVT